MRFLKLTGSLTNLAVVVSLLFIVIMGGFFFIFYRQLPPQVPLFYSRPWGERQLVSPSTLLFLPSLSLAVLIINILISRFLMAYPFLINVLFWSGALFSFLSLIDLIKIITTIL